MPLSMMEIGRQSSIKKIGGRDEARRFLEGLGFVVGGEVTVVNKNGGNVIVNVKDARVAISSEMANRIIV